MRYLLLSVVGGVHVAVIGGVLLMQGCGTTRGPVALPAAPPMPPALAEEDIPPVASGVEAYKPATVEEAVAAAMPAPRPSAPAPVPSTTSSDSTRTYVVGRGDSLSVIARRHGVSTAEIMILNNISDPNRIRMGQSLKLPAGAALKAPEAPKAVTPKTSSAPAATSSAAGAGSYVVKAGDSLSVLAHRNGTTVKAMQELNGLTNDKIVVGQKLKIPAESRKPAAPAPAPKPVVENPPVAAPVTSGATVPSVVPAPPVGALAPEPVMPSTRNSYTVQVGDDILTVASGHNVSISDLRRANNLTSDTLIPGQTLVIPAAE